MKRLALVAGIAVAVTGSIAAVYQGGRRPEGEDANAAAKAARTKPHVMFDPAEYAGDGQPSAKSLDPALHLSFDYWRAMFFPAVKPPAPVQHPLSPAWSPAAQDLPPQSMSPAALGADSARGIFGGQISSSSGGLDGAFRMAGVDRALQTSMSLFEHGRLPYLAATRVPGTSNSDPGVPTQTPTPNSIAALGRSGPAEAMALAWARYFQIGPSGALFASLAIESRTYSPGAGYWTLADSGGSFLNGRTFSQMSGLSSRTLGAGTEFLSPDSGSQELPPGLTLPGNGPSPQTPNLNLDDDPSAAVPEPRSLLLVAAALYFAILMGLSSTPRR